MERTPLEILRDVGALIVDDHLVYASGKHGSAYVNKDALYPHTGKTAHLCKAMAETVHRAGIAVDLVIGPVIGGVILSQWTAYHVSKLARREAFSGYAEKTGEGPNDPFVLKRGYETLAKGKNVLFVEDVLNTGGSAKRGIEAVRGVGGNLVAVAALCNRGGVTPADLGAEGVPLFSLVDVKLDAWDEATCPLCADNVPINVTVGKGKQFLERKASR